MPGMGAPLHIGRKLVRVGFMTQFSWLLRKPGQRLVRRRLRKNSIACELSGQLAF